MEESIVRDNLMKDVNYRPYCGNNTVYNKLGGCSNPKTYWDNKSEQFRCPQCMWISEFPEDFIKRYKEKHNL